VAYLFWATLNTLFNIQSKMFSCDTMQQAAHHSKSNAHVLTIKLPHGSEMVKGWAMDYTPHPI